ncbi:hypothetical protein B484DRAFT_404174 [Ochromonadaceae sp. CCMP2298]|nr:hypothetical protein B484DRAFT_404174 [Ochromonadaceae sp. CCMP2298]
MGVGVGMGGMGQEQGGQGRAGGQGTQGPGLARSLTLHLGEVRAVTETDVEIVELAKQGLCCSVGYFLVRVVNECDVTQVTMLQTHSNRMFVFIMAREHIDRMQTLDVGLDLMLRMLQAHPLVKPLLATPPRSAEQVYPP